MSWDKGSVPQAVSVGIIITMVIEAVYLHACHHVFYKGNVLVVCHMFCGLYAKNIKEMHMQPCFLKVENFIKRVIKSTVPCERVKRECCATPAGEVAPGVQSATVPATVGGECYNHATIWWQPLTSVGKADVT